MGARVFSFDDKATASILADITALRRDIVPLASNWALNRTASQVRTRAVRAVSKATGIIQRKVKERIEIEGSTPATLEFTIKAQGRRFNLIEFVPKGSQRIGAYRVTRKGKLRRGTGVKAKAWANRREYKGTFIGSGRSSGKLLVYKKDASKPSGITGVWGPSIPKQFIEDTVKRIMDSTVDEVFEGNLAHDITRRLSRSRRR